MGNCASDAGGGAKVVPDVMPRSGSKGSKGSKVGGGGGGGAGANDLFGDPFGCGSVKYEAGPKPAPRGKDPGTAALGGAETYENAVLCEYVWLDGNCQPRSKTRTVTAVPKVPEDLPVWNFDGSSTGQSPGEDSDVYLIPRCLFKDPFRGGHHMLVMAECVDGDMNPARANHRARCQLMMEKYGKLDPWFGVEQEYTLMRHKGKNGVTSSEPLGFNTDGSAPAPQGPYYCGAGSGMAIGREIVEAHAAACIYSGVKIAGINAEVMPGQWEYQIGPCRGVSIGDHMHMSRYIMQRCAEKYGMQVTFHPKPAAGDWNGAGCHTNFSVTPMREAGGLDVITKVCEAFGAPGVPQRHLSFYGEDNDKRLTGAHETCSINDFKFGTANRAASIRIPRETAKNGKGYMEDRRPAANCDPYGVCMVMMETTGKVLMPEVAATIDDNEAVNVADSVASSASSGSSSSSGSESSESAASAEESVDAAESEE